MSEMSNKANKILLPLMLVISFAAVILLQLGFIFIMIALVPSLVAYFLDNHPGYPLFKTVLACNMSAMLPIIAPMLKAAASLAPYDAISLMGNPMNWIIVFAGSALGWILVFLCRIIASFIMTIMYEYKIVALERSQKKFIEEWGQNIKK